MFFDVKFIDAPSVGSSIERTAMHRAMASKPVFGFVPREASYVQESLLVSRVLNHRRLVPSVSAYRHHARRNLSSVFCETPRIPAGSDWLGGVVVIKSWKINMHDSQSRVAREDDGLLFDEMLYPIQHDCISSLWLLLINCDNN